MIPWYDDVMVHWYDEYMKDKLIERNSKEGLGVEIRYIILVPFFPLFH